ncbi:MAG: hypothetical protein LUD79_01685 [Oscillospiraceae bacterium]|nr:hypothetical protein [Oscillospiraceae bacterium]
MYSYEDRLAAVELYMNSNISGNTVVQELGYPSSTNAFGVKSLLPPMATAGFISLDSQSI